AGARARGATHGRAPGGGAAAAPPSIPFWLGEAPGRSDELSFGVARLRAEIDAALAAEGVEPTLAALCRRLSLPEAAGRQVVEYLDQGRKALGAMPTQERIVLERFFDESGGKIGRAHV